MKIAMLLSGGVDSSVALALLKSQGHEITAFYLKIWLEDELSYLGDCPWQEDLSYAQRVCEKLNVPLEIVSLQQAYHERVIAYTLDTIQKGHTPNPDIMCNSLVKFGAFLEYAGDRFDKVATGHYAGVIQAADGTYYLVQTPDPVKDQTYFLSRLTQAQLAKSLFPLDRYTKQEVRALAQEFDLPTKDRKDSQGLCFLGKISFKDFIKHHVGTRSGKLVEYETGKVLGRHEGFWFYTIGQRQGLGLSHGPWYVVKKDPEHNIVYISNTYHEPAKDRTTLFITDVTCLEPIGQKAYWVKLRHGAHMHRATVSAEHALTQNVYQVTLSESDQGIAAGQFAVLYDEDRRLVVSGIIQE